MDRTLARWAKKEGDSIAVDDLIAEVETDKATMSGAPDPGVPQDPSRRGACCHPTRPSRSSASRARTSPLLWWSSEGSPACRRSRPPPDPKATAAPALAAVPAAAPAPPRVRMGGPRPRRWCASWRASTTSTSPSSRAAVPAGGSLPMAL
ncbi:MAG: biotin/lipoyl-containing protein [Sandaracinaceae bacterium]